MDEVLVIGAGVAGLTLAAELAARGVAPRIVDAGGGPGPQSCSWWAGGMLAPFCEGESAEEPVTRLGREAADWWQARTGVVGRAGTLVLAPDRDRGELDRFARRTVGHRVLDRGGIGEIEPDLGARFSEGLFFEEEAHLSPRTALGVLVEDLKARGIPIERDSVVPQPGKGVVFDCRGLSARPDLPRLRGVKGEMVVLRCPEIALCRPVRLLHPRHPLYIVPRGDGVFMLGATQIETGDRSRLTTRALLELLSAAYALHPAFAEAEVVETGVDARPAFPDNLPRVTRRDGVFRLNGLFRHGFLLAPALARMAADWVLDGKKGELCHED